jgi:hypothetical protein
MLRGMPAWRRRSRPLLLCACLSAVACGRTRPSDRPSAARSDTRSDPRATAPADQDLYPVDEALRDALSGPWEYVGTGPWPGNNRLEACAFRNARVLVVNAYCSIKETQAFRVDVYSPRRGRVRVYAESDGPVSARTRPRYFTFTAESEPAPPAAARLPALTLNMSFAELRAYEEQRYHASLPGCFGGQERREQRSGCLDALAPYGSTWRTRNRAFLEDASDDWYTLVHELRTLSVQYGQVLK